MLEPHTPQYKPGASCHFHRLLLQSSNDGWVELRSDPVLVPGGGRQLTHGAGATAGTAAASGDSNSSGSGGCSGQVQEQTQAWTQALVLWLRGTSGSWKGLLFDTVRLEREVD